MSRLSKASPLSATEEAEIIGALKQMESDTAYCTDSQYIADSAKYPTNVITFTQKHMNHLRKFPGTNTDQYISNLKLMTKTR